MITPRKKKGSKMKLDKKFSAKLQKSSPKGWLDLCRLA
jgi:hypothetical protein